MTTVDQSLLNAIRVVVGEAVAPLGEKIDVLTGRVDGLTGRVDGLTQRVERVETEQQLQRQLLYSMQEGIDEQFARFQESIDERFTRLELRLTNLEGISLRLENEIGTIETRTGQIYSDVLDLLELQDKVNEGFNSFKKELQQAFTDIGAVQETQQTYGRQMRQLRQRVDQLEQRLAKIEVAGGAHE
jgi:chromosome segregation ATPase